MEEMKGHGNQLTGKKKEKTRKSSKTVDGLAQAKHQSHPVAGDMTEATRRNRRQAQRHYKEVTSDKSKKKKKKDHSHPEQRDTETSTTQ